jgi:hypothetical protein
MKKQDTINTVKNNDDFSSGLMEQYNKWMGGDCFQNTDIPDLHLSEAPFDGMDPQSHGAEIENTLTKKKGPKKESPKAQLATKEETEVCEKCGGNHATEACPNILEREEIEIDGELMVLEKIKVENWDNIEEGSMKTARANVGASTCWKGYKAKGTKMKGGKSVPNCVKEDEFHHQKDKDGNTIPHEDEIKEGKKGLYDNIHAKRKRGESPAKPGDKGYPAKDAFKKAAESVEHVTEKKLDPVGKEDGDIDNDGDKDKSDKYLLARRKKVGKIIAMSKKK